LEWVKNNGKRTAEITGSVKVTQIGYKISNIYGIITEANKKIMGYLF